jgi:hypothetical protein
VPGHKPTDVELMKAVVSPIDELVLAPGETRNDVVDAPGSRFRTATRISRLRARALLSAARGARRSLPERGHRAPLGHGSGYVEFDITGVGPERGYVEEVLDGLGFPCSALL